MKKIALLTIAMMMALFLMACGSGNEGTGSQMTNPMTEVASLEELSEKADCALIQPENVSMTDEAFYMIDGNPQIAEYSFKVDGIDCFLRFAKAPIEEDISGIYTENGTLFANSEEETAYVENDELKAQRWVTVDGQYVFAALDNSGWDWTAFNDICSQFMKMEPKTWNADVPFAAYQELEGNYMDESGNVYGAISIKGDHAALYVIITQEDESRMYWEMEAVLDGSNLVYDKETISRIVYDQDAGETETTALDDGGAGSVELKDGRLIFANASSDQLKALTLQRMEE